MPLLDHFHPPLSLQRHWEGFDNRWAAAISDALNELLPPDYYADFEIHWGPRVEIDVAAFDAAGQPENRQESHGGTATLAAPVRVWQPPAADFQWPALFPDSLEVRVMNREAGPTLVAAVELVSPGNKDCPEAREAFASKCAAYLQQGVGLVVVDVVTSRRANLHNAIAELLHADDTSRRTADLYAVAYQPLRSGDADRIDVWTRELAVGEPLVTLPLPLDKGQRIPLDLDACYTEACVRSRMPV